MRKLDADRSGACKTRLDIEVHRKLATRTIQPITEDKGQVLGEYLISYCSTDVAKGRGCG